MTQVAATEGSGGPVVLHVVDKLLRPTETFIQARMVSGEFTPLTVTWSRVADGLAVPCPSLAFDEGAYPWLGSLGSLGGRARGRINLYHVLRRVQPDVVHAHFGWTGRWICGACRALDLPLVTGFHGRDATADVLVPKALKRYQHLFAYNEAMIVEGRALAKHLTDAGGRPETVKLLPLALPSWALEAPRRAVAWSAPVFRMLQVARFVEKKGIDITLKALALARVEEPALHLTLVGSGELEEEIHGLIDSLRLRNHVELPGFVPFDELPDLIGNAHAMIQPSRTARDGDSEGGAPTILIHTQAQGVPILGSTHADLPGFVKHGKTGLLAPVNDPRTLAEHIVRLARDRSLTAEMGAAARPWVLHRNDPDRCRRLRERIYRHAIGAHWKRHGGAPKPATVRAQSRAPFVRRWFRDPG